MSIETRWKNFSVSQLYTAAAYVCEPTSDFSVYSSLSASLGNFAWSLKCRLRVLVLFFLHMFIYFFIIKPLFVLVCRFQVFFFCSFCSFQCRNNNKKWRERNRNTQRRDGEKYFVVLYDDRQIDRLARKKKLNLETCLIVCKLNVTTITHT